jgi:alpha-L-fucosidase
MVDTWNGSDWVPCSWIRGEETTTVGHKRLLRLASPATSDEVRIRITGSRMEPTLAEIGLFKQAELVQPPVIAERDSNGAVMISDAKGLTVVYTTDGTMPTAKSTVYRAPIELPNGGTVNAASIGADGRMGMIATRYMPGLAPKGWKVVAVDGKEINPSGDAGNAIDGKANTIWQASETPLPHSLTVDMGREIQIGGFAYLPRPERNAPGLVDSYRLEISTDGKQWKTVVDEGRFANIRNNPVLQEVTFPPAAARFFRFTALREVNGNNALSVAEITVLPPESSDAKNR